MVMTYILFFIGATNIDNLAKNTSISSITSSPIPVTTIPVKSAVTTCTAPTIPIPDYKIDEFLDRQNQIIAPQFQDEC